MKRFVALACVLLSMGVGQAVAQSPIDAIGRTITSIGTSAMPDPSCISANGSIFNSYGNYKGNRWGVKIVYNTPKTSGCALLCQYLMDNRNNPSAISSAIAQGKPRGCFADLTIRDYQPSLFAWYDNEISQLKRDPRCAPYQKNAESMVYNTQYAEDVKKSALLKLFFDAQGNGCRA